MGGFKGQDITYDIARAASRGYSAECRFPCKAEPLLFVQSGYFGRGSRWAVRLRIHATEQGADQPRVVAAPLLSQASRELGSLPQADRQVRDCGESEDEHQ
jgi:hypothetical protein